MLSLARFRPLQLLSPLMVALLASKEEEARGELLLPSELAQRRHRSSNDGGGEVFEDHEQDLSREHPRISSTTYYSPTALLL